MAVRPIRSGSRYAMRLPTRMMGPQGRCTARGLLIELSLEGARVSNLGNAAFAQGQCITLALESGHRLAGTIRWAHDGIAGVKLDAPLRNDDMVALLDFNEMCQQPVRYGT